MVVFANVVSSLALLYLQLCKSEGCTNATNEPESPKEIKNAEDANQSRICECNAVFKVIQLQPVIYALSTVLKKDDQFQKFKDFTRLSILHMDELKAFMETKLVFLTLYDIINLFTNLKITVDEKEWLSDSFRKLKISILNDTKIFKAPDLAEFKKAFIDFLDVLSVEIPNLNADIGAYINRDNKLRFLLGIFLLEMHDKGIDVQPLVGPHMRDLLGDADQELPKDFLISILRKRKLVIQESLLDDFSTHFKTTDYKLTNTAANLVSTAQAGDAFSFHTQFETYISLLNSLYVLPRLSFNTNPEFPREILPTP